LAGMLRVRIHMGCYGALHNSVPRIIALHKDARARPYR
jgi:hypothetical protein